MRTPKEKHRRLGLIIKIIANQPGVTLSGLGKQLEQMGVEVTERTLAKDVALLKKDFGLVPPQDRLRQGYSLEEILTVGATERTVVLDALSALGFGLGDADATAIFQRLQKTPSLMTSTKRGGSSRVLRARNIYTRQSESEDGVEKLLNKAIAEGTAISVLYKSPRLKEEIEFSMFPLFKVFHERGWYLIGRQLQDKVYFPYRIDRIAKLRMLDVSANASHEDDLKEAQLLLGSGWAMSFPHTSAELNLACAQEEAVVRFDRTVAPFLTEGGRRHPLGEIVPTKDGTGDVLFKIRLADYREFQQWVRSFGAKAWFIAPDQLVESERTELRRMYERYGLTGKP